MKHLLKWPMIFLGVFLLIIGLITFPLPIPIGLPIVLLGIALLVRYSCDAHRLLSRLGKRHPLLGELLTRLRKEPCEKPVKDQAD
jgi:hypothetical protein